MDRDEATCVLVQRLVTELLASLDDRVDRLEARVDRLEAAASEVVAAVRRDDAAWRSVLGVAR